MFLLEGERIRAQPGEGVGQADFSLSTEPDM